MDEMVSKVEFLKSLSIANIMENLQDELLVTLQDERENDILVRLIPDEDLKFAFIGEVQGLLYHNALDVAFTVYIKQSVIQDVILDQVSDCDKDMRTLLILEASKIAEKALASEKVHDARPAIIKYQMLMELVQLLAS